MKDVFKDSRLSLKAKGLYFCLVNKKDSTLEDLCKMSRDGRDSTRNAIKELKEKGYLIQNKIREGGRFTGSEWIFPKETN